MNTVQERAVKRLQAKGLKIINVPDWVARKSENAGVVFLTFAGIYFVRLLPDGSEIVRANAAEALFDNDNKLLAAGAR